MFSAILAAPRLHNYISNFISSADITISVHIITLAHILPAIIINIHTTARVTSNLDFDGYSGKMSQNVRSVDESGVQGIVEEGGYVSTYSKDMF